MMAINAPNPALALITVVASVCGCSALGQQEQRQPAEDVGFAVVELFTSQGCSSCPPADALLAKIHEIAQRDDRPVYALSMHVDYWNRLGWDDPYSLASFSNRQRRYAKAADSNRVYTPQMIVNGTDEFVGSDGKQALIAINAALARKPSTEIELQVQAGSQPNHRAVDYKVTGANRADQLVLCLVQDVEPNQVARGENAGRKLSHTGVVRKLETMELVQSPAGRREIAWESKSDQVPRMRLVAFVQNSKTMVVSGAADWSE